MEPPRALLLDLDDTILDDRSSPACWRLACRELAPTIGLPATVLCATIERRANRYWNSSSVNHRDGRMNLNATRRAFVREAFQELGLANLALADQLADLFSQMRVDTLQPMPGALAALERLNQLGIPLALITNGEAARQRHKLVRFELERHFACIVVEGEFGVGKPEPEVYLHAMARLGVLAEGTWMVGDNLEWDVAAPKRLGISAAWVDHSSVGLPRDCHVEPDRIACSFAELVTAWWA